MLKSSNSFAHKTLYWICSASNRGFPASAFTEFKIQNWCFFPAICSKGWKVKVVGSLRKGASIICNLLLLHIWQFLYCSRICWLSERDIPYQRQLLPPKITWLSVSRSATLHWKRFQSFTICGRAFQCKAFQRERNYGPTWTSPRRNVGRMEGIANLFQVTQFSKCEIVGFHSGLLDISISQCCWNHLHFSLYQGGG